LNPAFIRGPAFNRENTVNKVDDDDDDDNDDDDDDDVDDDDDDDSVEYGARKIGERPRTNWRAC